MVVEIFLTSALLCIDGACHSVLVGKATPRGEFPIVHQATKLRGYGGDILTFKETATERYAIHRTWPGRERLYAHASVYRRVTNGCVNVPPELYDHLVALGVTSAIIKD